MVYLEIISSTIAILGYILVTYKNRMGFMCWIISNVLWVTYGLKTGQYFFTAQYVIFTAIALFGFTKWSRE